MSWAPPDPQHDVPCPFFRCWIGPCGETDRSKCRHSRDWKDRGPFGRQRADYCQCGRPALSECESAGSLVCGNPICHVGYCHGHGGSCPPFFPQ